MKATKLFQALFANFEFTIPVAAKKEVKVRNTTPRKQAHAGYFHVSTKVVQYKDQEGKDQMGIVGVTYESGVEAKPYGRRDLIRAGLIKRNGEKK